MRKIQMFMFMTIDGQAQFPAYAEPPYTDAADDPMWEPRMASIDTIILGANAYRKWAAHWPKQKDNPKASDWQRNYSRFADRCQKVVFSTSLKEPLWENTHIARGTPTEEAARLKAAPGGGIALGGGPRIAQSFLDADLVDEMILEVHPSIVGRGKHLFRTSDDPNFADDVIPIGSPGRHDFLLGEARALNDGTLFVRYELNRK